MTKRMYRKGRKITNIDELVKQEFIYFHHKITHNGWFLSWPVRLANDYIHRGILFTAIKNESEDKE